MVSCAADLDGPTMQAKHAGKGRGHDGPTAPIATSVQSALHGGATRATALTGAASLVLLAATAASRGLLQAVWATLAVGAVGLFLLTLRMLRAADHNLVHALSDARRTARDGEGRDDAP